jgi:hypothetical protein
MLQFGSGVLWGIPTIGNLAANVTPQRFGTLQDVSVDISQKLVELMGANKGPDDVAPSDMKVTGKAGIGKLDINIYNHLFFANSVTTSATGFVPDEPHAVPATSAYTITVAGSATFSKDLGVLYQATVANGWNSTPLTRIPGGTPSLGEYTVSAGVYTFAAADASAAVLISYNYISSDTLVPAEAQTIPSTTPYKLTVAHGATFVADEGVVYASGLTPLTKVFITPTVTGTYEVNTGTGEYTFAAGDEGVAVLISYTYRAVGTAQTLTVTNQLQGYGPVFELYLFEPYQGQNGMHLYACRSSKLTQPRKRDGYRIDSFEFTSYPNPAGNWIDYFQATS